MGGEAWRIIRTFLNLPGVRSRGQLRVYAPPLWAMKGKKVYGKWQTKWNAFCRDARKSRPLLEAICRKCSSDCSFHSFLFLVSFVYLVVCLFVCVCVLFLCFFAVFFVVVFCLLLSLLTMLEFLLACEEHIRRRYHRKRGTWSIFSNFSFLLNVLSFAWHQCWCPMMNYTFLRHRWRFRFLSFALCFLSFSFNLEQYVQKGTNEEF